MLARIILGLGLTFGLAAVTPALADEPMTAQQILKLAPGTFKALVKGRYELTVVLTRDGIVLGKASGMVDRGRWTVQNGQLCIVLPTWTRGRVECSEVVADNGWFRGRNVAFRRL